MKAEKDNAMDRCDLCEQVQITIYPIQTSGEIPYVKKEISYGGFSRLFVWSAHYEISMNWNWNQSLTVNDMIQLVSQSEQAAKAAGARAMRSEEELAELTKMAQQLEEELDRSDDVDDDFEVWWNCKLNKLFPRTREELGATTHQLAEKESFDFYYSATRHTIRIAAIYNWANEIKPIGASASSRGAWGVISYEEGPGVWFFRRRKKILLARLSFKLRCWKRTWRARRIDFCWPARL